jgi:hypothetical protein
MPYKRKTVDEWQLLANYGHGHGWEVETAESAYDKIKARRQEYRENAPQYSYKIQCKRVHINQETTSCGK